jgi:hypothetical protein
VLRICLLSSTIQTIWKNRDKIIGGFEEKGLREKKDFDRLNEVMSMGRCLSGLSKGEVV